MGNPVRRDRVHARIRQKYLERTTPATRRGIARERCSDEVEHPASHHPDRPGAMDQ